MPGLLRGIARTAVVAGTATAVSNRVSRRQANRWAQQDQSADARPQYAEPQYAQPPTSAADPGTDKMMEQLLQTRRPKGQGHTHR